MKSLAKTTSTAATVVSATGALFALQHHAEAAIVYSGLENITASFAGSFGVATAQVFLNNAGADLGVGRYPGHVIGQAYFGFFSGARVLLNGSGGLKKLAAGNVISAPQFGSATGGDLRSINGSGAVRGTWAKGQTGFAAFQETNGDLGWVHLEWTSTDSDSRPNSITLLGSVYDTTPGESILAGQTFENAPEPSRALLLLAGVGSMALRRRRKQES